MVVEYLCDRVAVMYLGTIVEIAPAEELFDHPLHPYTQALIAAAPKLDVDRSVKKELLEGDPGSPFDDHAGCRFAPRCRLRHGECLTQQPELIKREGEHYVACLAAQAVVPDMEYLG
jgi:oligopeptide/dipeptide ABC transporter ATP-binding protein